jgi:hypothetical protein
MEYKLQKLCEQRLLEEGRKDRYYQMLQGVLSDNDIKVIVRNAIIDFKREDRIIWFLRLYKALAVSNKITKMEKAGFDENNSSLKQLLEWRDKFLKYTYTQIKSEAGNFRFSDLRDFFKYLGNGSDRYLREVRTDIKHFLSLKGADKIQNYEFGWKTPMMVIDDLKKLEEEWLAEGGNGDEWIDITEELNNKTITILHDFGEGLAWLDLKRQYCSDEGNAMGHCGNTADYHNTETVLSFRTIKKKKGNIYSRPSLTFILEKDGYLGEMKGRANEKPNEKYHKYILKLLTFKGSDGDWLIKGIRGGGYLPESNFSLDDLSEGELKQLFSVRPDLKPLSEIYKEEGLTENVLKKIKSIGDFSSIDTERGYIYFDAYDNLGQLFDYVTHESNNPEIKSYYPYITGDEFFDYDSGGYYDEYTLKDLYKTTLNGDGEFASKVWKYIKYNYGDTLENNNLDIEREYSEQYDLLNDENDDIIDELKYGHDDGIRSGSEGEMYTAFKSGLNDLRIQRSVDEYKVALKFSDVYGDGQVYYWLSIPEAIEIYDNIRGLGYEGISDYLDGENEGAYESAKLVGDMSVPYNGFYDYDESVAIERFKEKVDEEGILDNIGNDDQVEMKLESSKHYLNYF